MIWPRTSALLAAQVLCACVPGESAAAPSALPHVLVVTIDTLRADHLGCYGYFRDTSPVLDALADEARVFERCMAPISQTLPTHTSLFTGLYPYEHGILANRRQSKAYVPSEEVLTFAQALTSAGYATAAFVAAEPVKREGGLATGFEHWWEPPGKDARAEQVVDRAMAWLDGRAADHRPLFLWVHLFDPHLLYEPPAPFDRAFTSDEAQAAYLAEVQVMPRSVRYETPQAHNLYDGEILYADGQLGRLFDHLRAGGMWDDLVVAVTSDHGEGLMQHWFSGHGHIWLEMMRVPLILRAPGLEPGRSTHPLGTNDVLPTLLARAPALAERVAPWLAQSTGQDVLAADFAPRPVIGQFPANRRPVAHSVVRGPWRLIVGIGAPRLYHLERDPHELEDLAAQHPDLVAELGALIDQTVQAQRARGRELGAAAEHDLSGSRGAGLEALGYGGGGGGDE